MGKKGKNGEKKNSFPSNLLPTYIPFSQIRGDLKFAKILAFSRGHHQRVLVLSKVLLKDSGQSPIGSVGLSIMVSVLFLFPSLRSCPKTIFAQLTFKTFNVFYFLPPPVGFFVTVFSFHDSKAVVTLISSPVSPESSTRIETVGITYVLYSLLFTELHHIL